MKLTKPYIQVISRPQVDWDAIDEFMEIVGGGEWSRRVHEADHFGKRDGETLIEFGGLGRMGDNPGQ